MVFCLGISTVYASNLNSDPFNVEELKSPIRRANPSSPMSILKMLFGLASITQAYGFTPPRSSIRPHRTTKLSGIKEDIENFIATKFLDKPDVQLESHVGLDFWAKRKTMTELYKTLFQSGKGSGPKFTKLANDAQEIVTWKSLGIPVPDVYTSSKIPQSEASLAKDFASFLIYNLNKFLPLTSNVQIPSKPDQLIKLIYPKQFSELFPAPEYPPILRDNPNNLVGALALEGPFASYIQYNEQGYFIDMSHYEDYPVKEGLYRLGGKAFFEYDSEKGQMKTKYITYGNNKEYHLDTEGFQTVQRILLATLSTDCTFFRHLLHTHMITAGTFCAVNNKFLDYKHPLRAIMHPFQMQTLSVNDDSIRLLIGNEYQFVPVNFSYDLDILEKMFSDRVKDFHISDMDIQNSLEKRGFHKDILEKIKYPYAENTGKLWGIIEDFVSSYVGHFYGSGKYESEEDFRKNEPEITAWYEALNSKYIPQGTDSYTGGLTRKSLTKLITLFAYTASVEHRNVSGVTYNFLIWAQDLANSVQLNGKLQNIGTLQSAMNVLFATNIPTPTVIDDFSQLFALDDTSREIMQNFTKAMKDYQTDLDTQGSDNNMTRINPRQIPTSVSS